MKIHRYSRYWNIRLNLARGYFYKVSRFRRSKFNLEKKKEKKSAKFYVITHEQKFLDRSFFVTTFNKQYFYTSNVDEIRGNVVRGNE